MSFRDRIVEKLAGGRIMRAVDIREAAACHPVHLTRLIDEGIIHRFGGGYRLADPSLTLPDETLVSLAIRFPDGVLGLMGAARHWGMTDIPNDSVPATIFVSEGASPSTGIDVKVVRKSRPVTLTVGVATVELALELTLSVTDPSRTVADLFACRAGSSERGAAQEALAILVRDHGNEAAAKSVEYARSLGRARGELETAVEVVGEVGKWNAPR